MREDDRQQNDPHNPEERSEVLQMLRVGIQLFRTQINLKVAQQMAQHEKHQANTGYGHDNFLADGRLIKRDYRVV
jgi:hypothetical protein